MFVGIYSFTLDKLTVVEFGANVGVLPMLCHDFGVGYLGAEPDPKMYRVAMREMYLQACNLIMEVDTNFTEWLEGKKNLTRASWGPGRRTLQ